MGADALSLVAERERSLIAALAATYGSPVAKRVQRELSVVRGHMAVMLTAREPVEPDVAAAAAIAAAAHEGQLDKAGKPYITHPERVAGYTTGRSDEVAAALLHDVLEDGPFYGGCVGMGGIAVRVSPQVAVAVHLLTRMPHVPPEDYYAAIRLNSLALAVKLADIRDNSSPERLSALPPETAERLTRKYEKARGLLLAAA